MSSRKCSCIPKQWSNLLFRHDPQTPHPKPERTWSLGPNPLKWNVRTNAMKQESTSRRSTSLGTSIKTFQSNPSSPRYGPTSPTQSLWKNDFTIAHALLHHSKSTLLVQLLPLHTTALIELYTDQGYPYVLDAVNRRGRLRLREWYVISDRCCMNVRHRSCFYGGIYSENGDVIC